MGGWPSFGFSVPPVNRLPQTLPEAFIISKIPAAHLSKTNDGVRQPMSSSCRRVSATYGPARLGLPLLIPLGWNPVIVDHMRKQD
jgi:hypothetical protein